MAPAPPINAESAAKEAGIRAKAKGLSLGARLSLLVTALIVGSGMLLAALVFGRFEAVLHQYESTQLRRGAEQRAQRLGKVLEGIARDLRLIAGTPPVQGIARAIRSGGIDPVDGSTMELWTGRLATIFDEVASNEPDYVQVRYIAIEGGQELVRVDRDVAGSATHRIEDGELQSKEHRSYVRDIVEVTNGQVYFSSIDLNCFSFDRLVREEPFREIGIV